MSFGSSNMAEAALGATFSLLLCVSIIQGFQNNVETGRYENTEAVVGQNVTLQCAIKEQPKRQVFSVEWILKRHKSEEKVALLSLKLGVQLFWPDVRIYFSTNSSYQFMVSSLHLPNVTKDNEGIYICDFATFPSGSIRTETKLRVKDVEVTCDANSTVDVHYAEKVIIHCQATSPVAEYRWTKNTTLVSVSKSLEILRMTDTKAGVYTLRVDAGNGYVQKEFTIRLQTEITSTAADTTAVSSQSSTITNTSWLGPTEGGLSTSHTSAFLSTDSTETVTAVTTNSVSASSSSVSVSITSPFTPNPDSEPSSTSAASTAGEATESTSTQEMTGEERRNQTGPHTQAPGDNSTVTAEKNSTSAVTTDGYSRSAATSPPHVGNDAGDEGTSQRHLLALIIIPVTMLIFTVGFLYRRHKIKQRMDLPPPFKPPPPPVKYVAVRQHETSVQTFPVSRCDSVADP